MSDWGGTHSTVPAVNNGLDQESAYGFDKAFYFGPALKEAVDNGWLHLRAWMIWCGGYCAACLRRVYLISR